MYMEDFRSLETIFRLSGIRRNVTALNIIEAIKMRDMKTAQEQYLRIRMWILDEKHLIEADRMLRLT